MDNLTSARIEALSERGSNSPEMGSAVRPAKSRAVQKARPSRKDDASEVNCERHDRNETA